MYVKTSHSPLVCSRITLGVRHFEDLWPSQGFDLGETTVCREYYPQVSHIFSGIIHFELHQLCAKFVRQKSGESNRDSFVVPEETDTVPA